MHLATSFLEDSDLGLKEIADHVGYDSEASFNKAFKSFRGLPPRPMAAKEQERAICEHRNLTTVNDLFRILDYFEKFPYSFFQEGFDTNRY